MILLIKLFYLFLYLTRQQEGGEDERNRRWAVLWRWLVVWQLLWLWQEAFPALLAALGMPLFFDPRSVSVVERRAPSALRQHRSRAPEWGIALSPAGDALAILQSRQISIRYASDNFRITKTTWKGDAHAHTCAQCLG